MTSPGDAPPVKPPPSFSPAVPLITSKARYPNQHESTPSLDSGLPASSIGSVGSSPSRPLSAATTSELPIRSGSPSSRTSTSTTPQLARSLLGSPLGAGVDGSEDIRSIIIRSFSPTVGVYASADTEELVKQKGFKGGFLELIRPFGEDVPGKVVIRDSGGASRGWEDYGVRFAGLTAGRSRASSVSNAGSDPTLSQIEEVMQRQLNSSEDPFGRLFQAKDLPVRSFPTTSPFYKLLLRQFLSAASPTPHETFGHLVACVIAISSRNTAPLESLRQLYADTSTGSRRPPEWVNPEFLRYYVLIHDEDRDDIAESTRLYDQMRRHFGLHCHLLRLRSNQCVVTDDDSVQAPQCEWLSPSEHLSRVGEAETLIDLGTDGTQYLFESDVMAIKAFVRELVAQSIVPYMENRVAIWNDQVASRRRGLSGRFMSLSRRWTGFGVGSRSGFTGSGAGGASGNYDAARGFYKPDTSEAILRKMADFAFMLRDWKLSASTYELLKSDYGNDKAWKYHAGVHEMYAVSVLLNPLSTSARTKLDVVYQAFDIACYSYLTRCSDTTSTLRCLTMAVELLKSRGGSATGVAARWAMRVMELGLVGPVGQILFSERISACYASKTAVAGTRWGARHRKAGMWSVLAADLWLKHGQPTLASHCLEEADRLYADVLEHDGVFPIPEMQSFVDNLKHAAKVGYLQARGFDTGGGDETADALLETETEETSEKFDDKRNNRKSLVGMPASLELGYSSPPELTRDNNNEPSSHDDFERA